MAHSFLSLSLSLSRLRHGFVGPRVQSPMGGPCLEAMAANSRACEPTERQTVATERREAAAGWPGLEPRWAKPRLFAAPISVSSRSDVGGVESSEHTTLARAKGVFRGLRTPWARSSTPSDSASPISRTPVPTQPGRFRQNSRNDPKTARNSLLKNP